MRARPFLAASLLTSSVAAAPTITNLNIVSIDRVDLSNTSMVAAITAPDCIVLIDAQGHAHTSVFDASAITNITMNDQGLIAFASISQTEGPTVTVINPFTSVTTTEAALPGSPADLNNNNTIVGSRQGPTASAVVSFRYRPSLSLTNNATSYNLLRLNAINESETAAGSRLEDNASYAIVQTTNGDTRHVGPDVTPDDFGLWSAVAVDINEHDVVAGHATIDGMTTLFREDLQGQLEMLDQDPAWLGAEAVAINNQGYVIGNALTLVNGWQLTDVPFVWTPDGELLTLASLIDDTDWEFLSADAINDQNQIAGRALYQGVATTFLLDLDTIPSPGSLTLFALSGAIVIIRGRKTSSAAR
ncbi:MAG: hypothetical protein AAGB34_05605 [Planctomycetota bacterium]